MKETNMTCRFGILILSGLWVGLSSSERKEPTDEPAVPRKERLLASVQINLDADKIRVAGFNLKDVYDKTRAVIHRPRFKMSELQALEFSNASGKTFKLETFGTVDVEFEVSPKKGEGDKGTL